MGAILALLRAGFGGKHQAPAESCQASGLTCQPLRKVRRRRKRRMSAGVEQGLPSATEQERTKCSWCLKATGLGVIQSSVSAVTDCSGFFDVFAILSRDQIYR